MTLTGELPDLIITSRTQSQETINKILKDQGMEVSFEGEVSDEPAEEEVVEEPVVETSPADATPPAEPVVEAAPVAAEPEPAAPGQPHKSKPGSKKYKEQRDQARIELEALKLEQSRRDAERLTEIQDLKRKLAETPAPRQAEAPPVAVVEQPKPALPEKPKLSIPKFIPPKLSDPDIDNDFDKLEEVRAQRMEEHNREVAQATEEYTDKIADWRDQVREAREREKRLADEAGAASAREAQEAATRAWQEDFNKIVEVGKTRYSDFVEKGNMLHFDEAGRPKPIKSYLMDEALIRISREDPEQAADLLHWIATHPDEASALAKATTYPEKDGKITRTPADDDRFLRKIYVQFGKVTASLTPPQPPAAGDEPDDEQEEEEVTEEPVVETPPAPVAAPPAPVNPPVATTPAPPAPKAGTPPAKKPTPPSTVGNRGTSGKKALSQMTQAEVASLDPGQYRKLYEEEYGSSR
jgi:hypothetical protein